MTQAFTVELNGVGPVLFKRSRRAKRLSITVVPFGSARVVVPYRVSSKKAVEFAISKADWIKKHLEKMRQYEQEYRSNLVAPVVLDKERAKELLTGRLRYLAEKHGFSYNRLTIRNQKTRWGSCSAKNNISLNAKLVRLPDELIDYVILHELVHTSKKDHSSQFWVELDKLVGNGKEMAVKLRKYRLWTV